MKRIACCFCVVEYCGGRGAWRAAQAQLPQAAEGRTAVPAMSAERLDDRIIVRSRTRPLPFIDSAPPEVPLFFPVNGPVRRRSPRILASLPAPRSLFFAATGSMENYGRRATSAGRSYPGRPHRQERPRLRAAPG